MKKNRLSRNYILQFTYQFIVLMIPLIISPYLTRTLGDTSLGIYSYSNSIVYYFTIFGMLGILKYGQRVISYNANDVITLRKKFWSLFIFHAITSVISIALYILFVLFFIKEDKTIYFILIVFISSVVFDITWFFFGIEDFKSVMIINTIIKIIECVSIFIFVKLNSDLYIYTLIISISAFLSNIILFTRVFRFVKPIKVYREDIIEHIKPVLLLAISVFAISFYTVFDKTLLGLLSTKENVAFYEYSNKIVNIPKAFISVIGTVMYPRSCDMIKNNNISGQKFYFKTSIIIVFYICFSSIFGFLSVGEEFATLYYGNDFSITGKLIISMSPLIFIVGFGEILRMQYLIPSGKDNLYVSSVILSALINICISIILIPILGINGVIIGTVIAESFGLIFQIVVSKDYIDFKFVFKNIMSFVAIGLIMYIFLVQIKDIFEISVIWLIFVISLGIVIYSLLTALYLAFCERGIVIKLINSMKKGKDY